jgi:hypothetical protein
VQVADRFHLVKNMSTTLEAVLLQHPAHLRQAARLAAGIPPPVHMDDTPVDVVANKAAEHPSSYSSRLLQRQANHTEVNRLRAEGMGIRAIGRTLALSRNTVRSYLRTDRLPAQVFPRTRPAHLVAQDAFLQAGRRFFARQTMWLLRRAPADLTLEEQRYVDALLATSPEIARAHRLTLAFLALVQQGAVGTLLGWLEEATHNGLPAFRSFAVGIRRDYAAVEAALTMEWNNGIVEGHVNRLKLLKRQGYGRASFDLLRQRVLHAPEHHQMRA